MIWYMAFLTGLLGSLHCMGMCGPIALALPVVGSSVAGKIAGRIIYNAGRIVTYSLMGALLGSFGLGLRLAGMQQSISIAAGVLIVLTAIFSSRWLERIVGNPFRWIKAGAMQKLFSSHSFSALFLIGFFNGMLPCGFVYVGLMAAVAMQGVFEGALFMALFGLGTFPLMFGVSLLGQFVSVQKRAVLRRFTPVLAVCIGVLFILRGLNLDIPYLSPGISGSSQVIKQCCRK